MVAQRHVVGVGFAAKITPETNNGVKMVMTRQTFNSHSLVTYSESGGVGVVLFYSTFLLFLTTQFSSTENS